MGGGLASALPHEVNNMEIIALLIYVLICMTWAWSDLDKGEIENDKV